LSRPSAPLILAASVAALLLPGAAAAVDTDSLYAVSNDFGGVGILQTPTARMRPDGELGFGGNGVGPYQQLHFSLQLLPWLESTVRYTQILSQPYSSSGDKHYKDRSLGFKARLFEEGEYTPALALGILDAGGTGRFSSQYLVSSYHFYNFDFSLGLAWGRMGSRGGIYNPFRLLGKHFDQSQQYPISDNGGTLGVSRLFSGTEISPIGGVEWLTPIKGVSLKLEYDGNGYQHLVPGQIDAAATANSDSSSRLLRRPSSLSPERP